MKAISKRLTTAMLLIAGVVFSFNSHAATIDLGPLSPGGDIGLDFNVVSGSFSDTWKFEVTSTGKLTGGFLGVFGISAMTASIGSDSYAAFPSPLPFFGPALLAPSVVLTPGHYTISVSGTAGGFFPVGGYVGAVGLSAVPVPAPVLLLGSAMLGLVGFARRRNA